MEPVMLNYLNGLIVNIGELQIIITIIITGEDPIIIIIGEDLIIIEDLFTDLMSEIVFQVEGKEKTSTNQML